MEEKWTFASAVSYRGQDFIIEIKPMITETGGIYLQSRTSHATKEQIKEAQENSTHYYTQL